MICWEENHCLGSWNSPLLLERSHSHADGRFVGLGVYSENALTSFSGWLLSLGFDLYTSSNQKLRGKACQVDRGVAVPGGCNS